MKRCRRQMQLATISGMKPNDRTMKDQIPSYGSRFVGAGTVLRVHGGDVFIQYKELANDSLKHHFRIFEVTT